MKEKTIYALGFFDGVHLGHQALLAACKDLAQKHGCATGAITFDRHPNTVINSSTLPLLYPGKMRSRFLTQYGAKNVIFLFFTEELMHKNWRDFLQMLVESFDAAGFVCGDDFRFGYKGEGNAQMLKAFCEENGLPCAIVPEQTVNGQRVSSTAIRLALAAGDLETANAMLGRPHTLTGTVSYGRGIGRRIGFPTANFTVKSDILLPCQGVYATHVIADGVHYPAVTNIGSRPTVGGHSVRIESWLLNFDDNLYDQELTVELHAYLRPEQKFDSLDELKAQIHKDAEQARTILMKRG